MTERDYGTCTCKITNDWCWACGHERRRCYESCQRGLHGWCRPQDNRFHAMEIDVEGVRHDSRGRPHMPDCTFDEPDVRFPVCTCGTWPELNLN